MIHHRPLWVIVRRVIHRRRRHSNNARPEVKRAPRFSYISDISVSIRSRYLHWGRRQRRRLISRHIPGSLSPWNRRSTVTPIPLGFSRSRRGWYRSWSLYSKLLGHLGFLVLVLHGGQISFVGKSHCLALSHMPFVFAAFWRRHCFRRLRAVLITSRGRRPTHHFRRCAASNDECRPHREHENDNERNRLNTFHFFPPFCFLCFELALRQLGFFDCPENSLLKCNFVK